MTLSPDFRDEDAKVADQVAAWREGIGGVDHHTTERWKVVSVRAEAKEAAKAAIRASLPEKAQQLLGWLPDPVIENSNSGNTPGSNA